MQIVIPTGNVFASTIEDDKKSLSFISIRKIVAMAKKQKQTSQNAGAPQDETPTQPREKRRKNSTPVQKKEKPRPPKAE